MDKRRWTIVSLLLLCLASVKVFAFNAYGGYTYTWVGGAASPGNNTKWSLAANWTSTDGGTLTPGAEAGDVANLPFSSLGQPTVDVTPANPLQSINVSENGVDLSVNQPITTIELTMTGTSASITGPQTITVQDSASITSGTVQNSVGMTFTDVEQPRWAARRSAPVYGAHCKPRGK